MSFHKVTIRGLVTPARLHSFLNTNLQELLTLWKNNMTTVLGASFNITKDDL